MHTVLPHKSENPHGGGGSCNAGLSRGPDLARIIRADFGNVKSPGPGPRVPALTAPSPQALAPILAP